MPKTEKELPQNGGIRLEEFRCLLRLSSIAGFGPYRIARLVRHFGSATAVIRSNVADLIESELVNQAGADAIRKSRDAAVERALLQRFSGAVDKERALLISDSAYPEMLRNISQPPLWLWIDGEGALDDGPRVALVGSRQATRQGMELTQAWSYRLAAAGVTVVSGLALGIDAAAHRGALDAGGRTLAIMGTGLDTVYPRSHAALASEIRQSGLLVSEFHPSAGPRPHHFPQRNRVIAGLSHATIVMEAAKGSGSLITARMAQDEGREVGIVPGRPGDRNASGSNQGIRENVGELITDVDDILAMLTRHPDLNWQPPLHEHVAQDRPVERRRRKPVCSESPAGRLRHELKRSPKRLEELCAETGMSRAQAEDELLDLLLEGHVSLEADQRYRWVR